MDINRPNKQKKTTTKKASVPKKPTPVSSTPSNPRPKAKASSKPVFRSTPKPTPRSTSDSKPRPTKNRAAASSAKPALSKSLITELNETLNELDTKPSGLGEAKPGDRQRSIKKSKKPWSKRRKITFSIIGLLSILLLVGGYYTYKIIAGGSGIFSGNMLDIVKNEPLKKDQYGRTNVLVFGTSEDNEGHSGALLADSIMVLSVDQKTKKANMISIPRDLWVDYPNSFCSVGREGKINATYLCALEETKDEAAASLQFAGKVSEVIGTEVGYFARVNYTVVRDLVDSLGGVTVTIESDDPRGILDRNFDRNCPNGPNTCHFVKYENGPATLDGEHALALSRARNAKGGYGLSGSNFDREKNQQKILKAVQQKALSTGTLTNPNKVLALVESLGDNINSNLKTSELQTVIKVAQGLNPDSIKSLDLRKPGGGLSSLVRIGSYGEQSIVQPVTGLKDYSGIQSFIAQNFKPSEDTSIEN